ncbi:heavy metal-associated isoprenylated plant protein 3 isoform X1 [Cinnamomum micranthum f. kanehirae]|uniref:Heavy metal-associated isoprenylated plant protein 3 isoform X1 n=1 Tax=Cinnamomum micranthum f. kanehirae TaxID=337451 RepID=A0A443PLC2_9MAGN|nr:heavy metal-associated isoprenylated plant protein 3 isoform X1 [Cinnamomum micranthum f. kanehirae]
MGKKEGGDQKKGDGGKKEDGPITVVLKVDPDCKECAKEVKKAAEGFDGVKDAKRDGSNIELTVVGNVDPEKIRKWIEDEIKEEDQINKKVVLVSPLPKKDKADEKKRADEKQKEKKVDYKKTKGGGGGGEKADEKEKKADHKKPKGGGGGGGGGGEKNADQKEKEKKAKIGLRCSEGCIQKIELSCECCKGCIQKIEVSCEGCIPKIELSCKGRVHTTKKVTFSEGLKP